MISLKYRPLLLLLLGLLTLSPISHLSAHMSMGAAWWSGWFKEEPSTGGTTDKSKTGTTVGTSGIGTTTGGPITPPLLPPIDESQVSNLPLCNQLHSKWEQKVNPLPLVEWINLSNLANFYDHTFHSLLSREAYFNEIDSLGQYSLAFQPYGFHSNYDLEGDDYKQTTYGITAAGGFTIKEKWILGVGVGCWHSNFDWGNFVKDSQVNSFYVGPYASCLFKNGYLNLTLLGVYNMYDVHQAAIEGTADRNAWDIYGGFEAGLDVTAPELMGPSAFIQPNFNLNYLASFQQEQTINQDEAEVTIDSSFSDFFRSKLAVDFRKEFHKHERGFVIPTFSVGWVLMQPLSHGPSSTSCEDKKEIYKKDYPSSNQLYLGAKITGIHKRGILVSLGFEAYIAELYPSYAANMRFEWSW